jgi:hypothetical protein
LAPGQQRSQYVTVEGGRDSSTNYAIDGVRPLAAIQQPVAEPAARRGAGSQRPSNSFTTDNGQSRYVVSIVTKSGLEPVHRLGLTTTCGNTGTESANYFGQKPGDRTQAGATGGGPADAIGSSSLRL